MSKLDDIVKDLNALTERARLAGTDRAKTLWHAKQYHLHLPHIWSDVGMLLAEAVEMGVLDDDPAYSMLRTRVRNIRRDAADNWPELVWHRFLDHFALQGKISDKGRGGVGFADMLSHTDNVCAAALKLFVGLNLAPSRSKRKRIKTDHISDVQDAKIRKRWDEKGYAIHTKADLARSMGLDEDVVKTSLDRTRKTPSRR